MICRLCLHEDEPLAMGLCLRCRLKLDAELESRYVQNFAESAFMGPIMPDVAKLIKRYCGEHRRYWLRKRKLRSAA